MPRAQLSVGGLPGCVAASGLGARSDQGIGHPSKRRNHDHDRAALSRRLGRWKPRPGCAQGWQSRTRRTSVFAPYLSQKQKPSSAFRMRASLKPFCRSVVHPVTRIPAEGAMVSRPWVVVRIDVRVMTPVIGESRILSQGTGVRSRKLSPLSFLRLGNGRQVAPIAKWAVNTRFFLGLHPRSASLAVRRVEAAKLGKSAQFS